jgi:hypothetical protein
MSDGHVLFVWRATGYELVIRPGEPPEAGVEIELDGDSGERFLVTKVGPSPLPADRRPCAYLHPS